MKDPLITAIMVAVRAHDAQVDKAGQPYIFHCLRVLDQVRERLPLDIEAQCAAVLHDVIEDCGMRAAELEILGIPKRAINLIYSLTKTAYNGDYFTWIQELARARDMALPIIKLADVRDNGSAVRLELIADQADRERLRAKYERAHMLLVEGIKDCR